MSKKEESPGQTEKRRAELYAEIEKLARETEPAALAERSSLMTKAATEYERQASGFAFECNKWGSFLRIASKRLGNPFTGKYGGRSWGPGQSFATALNLENVTTIALTLGNVPDLDGELRYEFSLHSTGDDDDGQLTPRIYPLYPQVPDSRPHFEIEVPPNRYAYCDSRQYAQFRTPKYVRVSADDRIVFGGMKATLFVPAGRGDSVLNEILRAT